MNLFSLKNKIISDEQLMLQYCAGSQQSFNELYMRFSERLLHYFYRMLGHSEEKAQDFLQDIFLKLVEKPDSYNASQPFSTWLFSVANNMCKNEYRRMEVRENTSYIDDCKAANRQSEQQQTKLDVKTFNKELDKQLEKLSDEERSCFILRYQEEFSIKEISAILGCAEGTVKSRLFYTLKKLSTELKEFNTLLYTDTL